MSAALPPVERLGSAWLGRLPAGVDGPAYDRSALGPGIAHIGVGAFHRGHQAEFTDDLLAREFGPWGIIGINVRPPLLEPTLGRQDGLYTRLLRENETVKARVIGSILRVVDSQDSAEPALGVLAAPEIDLISLTVTEKGYCHTPASGQLDLAHPDIQHDLAKPEAPRSVPGLILRALEWRRASHGRPVTVMSCDNIPSNGSILERVVMTLAERRAGGIADWISRNAAFPSTMVDRIVPATSAADLDYVERHLGYRDQGVVVGEPFRQWVIENRFAGRFPAFDRVGASLVADVEAFEHLKMRILNGAQTTLSYLGILAGLGHSFDDMADPLLAHFIRRMLVEESLPTLDPILGVSPEAYVEQSLSRLTNTAVRHRNHQIATDGSQKIVQRILNPIRDRLACGAGIALLCVPVAAWMTYLIRASERFGRAWPVEDPYAGRIAEIADRIGNDPQALCEAILAIDAIFVPALSADPVFRAMVAERLAGLLSDDPIGYLRTICGAQQTTGR